MVMRLAFRLARSAGWLRCWRIWAMALLMGIATILVLSGVSLIHLRLAEAQRDTQRRIIPALESPRSTDLLMLRYFDTIDDRQFPAFYIAPAQRDVDSVLPPGIETLPDPGTAVVSPALFDYLNDNPNVRASFPELTKMPPDVVQAGDEWLLFQRHDIPAEAFPENLTIRVSAFGRAGFPLSPFGSVMTLLEMIAGVSAFAFVPAALVVMVTARLGSKMRRGWQALYFALGAPRRTVAVRALHDQMQALVPGIALGTLVWWVAIRQATKIPLVDYRVFRGDLAPPATWIVIALMTVVLLVLVTDVVSAWVAYGRSFRTEPTGERVGSNLWRLVPIGVLVFGIAGKFWISGGNGEVFFFGALAVTVLLIPLLLPSIIGWGAVAITHRAGVHGLLAGRLLASDSVRMSRPVGMIAAMIVIAIVVVGYMALNRAFYIYPEVPGEDQMVLVSARSWEFTAEDVAELQKGLEPNMVVPVLESGGSVTFGTACEEIAAKIDLWSCTKQSSIQNNDRLSLPEAARLLFPMTGDGGKVSYAPQLESVTDVLVVAPQPDSMLVENVGVIAREHLRIHQVLTPTSFQQKAPARLDWLIGGLWTGVGALGIAAVVTFIDGFLELRTRRQVLVSIGLTKERLAGLDAVQFLIVYLAAVTLGAVVGVVGLIVGLSDRNAVEIPWSALSIGGAIVLTAMFPLGSIIWLVARNAQVVAKGRIE